MAPSTEEDTTFNFGLSLVNLGWLTADSAIFIISPFSEPVNGWVVETEDTPGTILRGTDAWAEPNGTSPYGRINSTLNLTSIKPYIKCKAKKGLKRMSAWVWEKLAGMEDSTEDPSSNLLNNLSFGTGSTAHWLVRDKSRTRIVNSANYGGNYSLALYGDPDCYKAVVQFAKGAIVGGQDYFFAGALAVKDISVGHYMFQVRWYDANG